MPKAKDFRAENSTGFLWLKTVRHQKTVQMRASHVQELDKGCKEHLGLLGLEVEY